ncbi:hypothetical protein [Granulicoccus sp. GXG6511]|uniref:hypothetical protein n=1 Tax=Granulicoccus sp. GXG6511 TaxID=3381351 RepID=UPI003D7C7B11
MRLEALIEHAVARYDRGVVEFRETMGLVSILRGWPAARARVVLQRLTRKSDADGALLISPVPLDRYPDMRVVTAVTRTGWTHTWMAIRAPAVGLRPWDDRLTELLADVGLTPHPVLDLAAVERFITGSGHVHTPHPWEDIVGYAVAAGMADYAQQIGLLAADLAALAESGQAAQASDEAVMEALRAADLMCAGFVVQHLARCAEALKVPRIVVEQPLPKEPGQVWALLRDAATLLSDLPWDFLDAPLLAQNLDLPAEINPEWWGPQALMGMKLLSTPLLVESLLKLQELSSVLANIAVDRIRTLIPDVAAYLRVLGDPSADHHERP